MAVLASCGKGKADSVFTYADTIVWDGQYDVVVIGFGAAGAVSAKYAAEAGANVLITEKAPQGESGGNSRLCGQIIMNTDDPESLFKYYKAMGGATKSVSDSMLRTYVNGIGETVNQVVNDYGADREAIFAWKTTGIPRYVSEYPEFEYNDAVKISTLSRKDVSNGALYRLESSAASSKENVDVWFDSPAVGLIQEPQSKTIIGVVIEREGKELNIRANNGVVMALGGFENNPLMMEDYCGLTSYTFNGTPYNTGDGIYMATKVGAKLWHMDVYEGSMGPFGAACIEGSNHWTLPPSFASGSVIHVGSSGERFLREDEGARHGHVGHAGTWLNPQYPDRSYLVFDKAKYDELMSLPSLSARSTVPTSVLSDNAIMGNTLEELCANADIDYNGLKHEIAEYNGFARTGNDIKLDRSAGTMSPISSRGPYYAVKIVPSILNTQGGPERNENAQILSVDDEPIPHLYSAGEFGGITSHMYNGGGNMAECLIFGKIAGTNAAKAKEPLPAYVQRTKVESSMVYVPGYATDISNETYETGENEYIGIGQGIGGDLVIRAKVEKGAITALEILKENETEGIGSHAIEQLPAMFVGMDSVDGVNGVDTVSGATVTSNALKSAVGAALQEAQK